MPPFRGDISDDKLLNILNEEQYLDIEAQQDILASSSIQEINKIRSDIINILSRKKNKQRINRESFLSRDDEENLNDFLDLLDEKVSEIVSQVKSGYLQVMEECMA